MQMLKMIGREGLSPETTPRPPHRFRGIPLSCSAHNHHQHTLIRQHELRDIGDANIYNLVLYNLIIHSVCMVCSRYDNMGCFEQGELNTYPLVVLTEAECDWKQASL